MNGFRGRPVASLADEIEVDKGTVLTKEDLPGRESITAECPRSIER
jgi:hypothetical protein